MNNTIELLERAIKSLERECFDFKEAHLIADLRAEAKRIEGDYCCCVSPSSFASTAMTLVCRDCSKPLKLSLAKEPAQPKEDPNEIPEFVKRYCRDELGWTEYRSPKPQPKREPLSEFYIHKEPERIGDSDMTRIDMTPSYRVEDILPTLNQLIRERNEGL